MDYSTLGRLEKTFWRQDLRKRKYAIFLKFILSCLVSDMQNEKWEQRLKGVEFSPAQIQ